MGQTMNVKLMYGDELLIAYLDLCGTKFVYSKFELSQQIERIILAVSKVLDNIENTFTKDKEFLYVHMYADSIVIAERPKSKIDKCADRLLKLMLDIQYQMLLDSELLQTQKITDSSEQRPLYMPILSRALIKRGKYYGLITAFESQIDNHFFNFSLVGGSSIIEMDEILEGLPMGVYIDDSTIGELTINQDRLLDVNVNGLKFVKPLPDFDYLREIFSSSNIYYYGPENIDDWVKQLIKSTDNNIDFKSKLIPWVDAVQGRRSIICKR